MQVISGVCRFPPLRIPPPHSVLQPSSTCLHSADPCRCAAGDDVARRNYRQSDTFPSFDEQMSPHSVPAGVCGCPGPCSTLDTMREPTCENVAAN